MKTRTQCHTAGFLRTVVVLPLLVLVCIVLTACGSSGDNGSNDGTIPTSPYKAADTPTPIDDQLIECNLLTPQEFEAILGAPMKDATKTNDWQCYFNRFPPESKEFAVYSFFINVKTPDLPGLKTTPRESFDKAVTSNPKMQPVADLGDEAYYLPELIGDGSTTSLTGRVFIMKGDAFIEIGLSWVYDPPTQEEHKADLIELAKIMVDRIP